MVVAQIIGDAGIDPRTKGRRVGPGTPDRPSAAVGPSSAPNTHDLHPAVASEVVHEIFRAGLIISSCLGSLPEEDRQRLTELLHHLDGVVVRLRDAAFALADGQNVPTTS